MQQIKQLMAELPKVWLNPGELFVAKKPSLVTTILGSCITVCLFHSRQVAGAMCHCLLPSGQPETKAHFYRYVDSTLPKMLQKLNKLGVPYNEMQAKLFGGAMVNAANGKAFFRSQIGPANVKMARHVLQEYEVPIVAECVGGHKGYKLFFHSSSGGVYMSRLGRTKKYKKTTIE